MQLSKQSENESNTIYQKKFLQALGEAVGIKLFVLIIIFSIIGVVLIYIGFEKSEESVFFYTLREVGKGIFITALISGAIKWYMARQYIYYKEERENIYRQELKEVLSQLKSDVSEQTRKIASYASSLDALQFVGATRFYRNRHEASSDIKAVLEKGPEEIKIIGISLNDFVRDENKELHAAWKLIEKIIKNGLTQDRGKKLTIQVLLIDPNSHGAWLRAEAEQENDATSRLKLDVEASIKHFLYLESVSSEDVKFQVRIYRSSPILYLFWTPNISFIQQYYFRPSHGANVDIPLVKYEHKESLLGCSVHDELKFHFNWIWTHASVSIDEYLSCHVRGVFPGIHDANIEQISYDADINKKRLIELINKTKNVLWIKGITLKSIFQYDGEIVEAISNLYNNKDVNVDIKVLILDPLCDQAKYRSFREYLLIKPGGKIKDFTDEIRKQQRLYKDVNVSVESIESHFQGKEGGGSKFQVKEFQSAPEAFILITDDVAVVEQYHYGKIRPSNRKILAGDIPMIEYKRKDDNIDVRNPYAIFRDHFEFVFKNCAEDLKI